MKVADLFVDLGIQGSDKTIGALTNTKKGVGDVASASFAMKAALLGAFYAVQQLFSASNRAGSDLTRFKQLMDTSTDTLQRYQYVAEQVGVSNEEVAKTFMSISEAFTDYATGKSMPEGLPMLSEALGGIDEGQIQKWMKNPETFIQTLSKVTEAWPKELRNRIFKSFGLSEGMIAAIARQAFSVDNLQKAPVYSESEIASLDRANAAWVRLGDTIEKAIGRFNAKHGEQLVSDITKIVGAVVKLTEALTKLGQEMKVFDLLKDALETAASAITTTSILIDDKKSAEALGPGDSRAASKPGSKGEWVAQKAAENFASDSFLKLIISMLALTSGSARAIPPSEADQKVLNAVEPSFTDSALFEMLVRTLIRGMKAESQAPVNVTPRTLQSLPPGAVIPPRALTPTPLVVPQGPANSNPAGTNINQTINQTMNFQHPGVDPRQTSDSVKQAAKTAFQQSPARSWGS